MLLIRSTPYLIAMEPVSATLGIVSAAVALAGLAVNIGRMLTTVVSLHKQSAALVYSLIGATKAIEVALNRIHAWLEAYNFPQGGDGSSFFEQLMASIDAGHIILGVLSQDLKPYTHLRLGRTSVSGRWKLALDESLFRNHCANLNLQVSSLHLLLATANL